MAREGFEELLALHDRSSGLRAFLGIHDTSRGPAFGGIRRYTYRNEKSALIDCLRLARAMSRKCALADVPGGGAKLVVLDQVGLDLDAAYRYLGEVVERFAGRYYAGPDVGTGWHELGCVAERTAYVTHPGERGPGDLAGATAAGVFASIAAALRQVFGEERWSERTFVVQGLGSVGRRLAERLRALDARVLAADLDEERAEAARAELGVEILPTGSELDEPCDVFSPCAMGGLLHDLSIQRLRSRIVCGAANNPLARVHHAVQLQERGILYVPDIVVSAGAVIRGAEFHLLGRATPLPEIEERIGRTVESILARAAERDRAPYLIAQHEADLRILRARKGESAGARRDD